MSNSIDRKAILSAFGVKDSKDEKPLRYGKFSLDKLQQRVPNADDRRDILKAVWDDPTVAEASTRAYAISAAVGIRDYNLHEVSRTIEVVARAADTPDAEWVCRNFDDLFRFIRRHEKRAERGRFQSMTSAILYESELQRIIPELARRFNTLPGVRWLDQLGDFADAPGMYRRKDPARAIDLQICIEPRRTSKAQGWQTVGQKFAFASAHILDDADLTDPTVREALTYISRFRMPLDDDNAHIAVYRRAKELQSDKEVKDLARSLTTLRGTVNQP